MQMKKEKRYVRWDRIIISILILSIIIFQYFPFDNDLWCKINKPRLNISFDKNIHYCYTEGWDKYCQMSYPEYCPNNEFSDYDRCLRTCVSSGLGLNECPCT